MTSPYSHNERPEDSFGEGYPEYPQGRHSYPGEQGDASLNEPNPYAPANGVNAQGKKNNLALWALVVSIVGAVFTLLIGLAPVAVVISIISFILAVVALKRVKNYHPSNARKGMALAGLIVSIITFILSIVISLFLVAAVGALSTAYNGCSQYKNDEAAFQACFEDQLNLNEDANL